jgi:hypothetical protein
MKESWADNIDKKVPLESHKLYLNIVYHESILPPLLADKAFANEKDDSTWKTIPIFFTVPWERTNLENC